MFEQPLKHSYTAPAPVKGHSLLALLRLPTKQSAHDTSNLKSVLTSDTDLSSTHSEHSLDEVAMSPIPKPQAAFFNSNGGKAAIMPQAQPNNKFKTELCKNFDLYGQCKWADGCFFAHGRHELKCKAPANQYYKTKPCKHFHHNGYCPYAGRCQYLHLKHERVYQELLKSLDSKAGFCLSETEYDVQKLAIKVDKMQPRLALFQRLTARDNEQNILAGLNDEC